MSIINKILLGLLLILFLVLSGVLLWQFVFKSPSYYAVYLETGDLYFGKLVYFPNFGLKNVHLIQTNPENKETPLSIQKFTNIFWGPSDYLKINRRLVVWTVKLNSSSQLATFLATNPNLLPQGEDNKGQNQLPSTEQVEDSIPSQSQDNNTN